VKKTTTYLFLALLSLSLVSAHQTHYYEKDYTFKEKIIQTESYPSRYQTYTTTTYINYNNKNRYSTEDYRNGYTYRTSSDYLKRYKTKNKECSRQHSNECKKEIYYEYVPYLQEYQKITCYNSPPKGKIFYITCN
jgi:hypothetical protein